MNEPEHTMGSKPDMVSLCPFCIRTTVGYIGGKHCPEIGHFLTAFALGKPFCIDRALPGLGIEELTPRVQIDDQHMSEHRLLVAAETTLGTFTLPGGAAFTTHEALL